jgi:hypothetical protein
LPPTLHRLLESIPGMHSRQARGNFAFGYPVGLRLRGSYLHSESWISKRTIKLTKSKNSQLNRFKS